MRFDEGIFELYSRMYDNRRESELSVEEYLGKCSDDPCFYAAAAERMLKAIGENNQDVSSLVGKVDIRKLEFFSQNDPDAYSYSGGLNRTTQGLMEFVEIFKAPIKMLHPLLTSTQEGNYVGSENIGGIPYQGIVLAHSKEAERKTLGKSAGKSLTCHPREPEGSHPRARDGPNCDLALGRRGRVAPGKKRLPLQAKHR